MNDAVRYFFEKGGYTIYPLVFLSVLSLSTIIERVWFWSRVLLKEGQILNRIIDSASRNWDLAAKVARDNQNHPIGNYLYGPLRLSHPEPEILHLAIESAADDELALMRRGDKILEAVIALSPLLGLLGTVFGLIGSLKGISLSDMGTAATEGVTLGISEALISTATGLVVAIFSLAFYRLFQGLWFNQVRVFRKAGSELELIYRQRWMDSEDQRYPLSTSLETPEKIDR